MKSSPIKASVTLCLVPEASSGPFVFHGAVEHSLEAIQGLGFDAVEIFAAEPGAVAVDLPGEFELAVSAVGTGAGMLRHGLSLTDPNPQTRKKARHFIKSMIEWGSLWKAPAIIGSMQGKAGGEVSRDTALEWLAEALDDLGQYALEQGVPLLIEPLNRYETNLLNTLEAGIKFLRGLRTDNVKLLADTFHMNIEESNPASALRSAKGFVGHVHFVDSNRRAIGFGHLDACGIAKALKDTGYTAYVSAEAFPLPDSQSCAQKTIESYGQLFG